MNAQAIPKAEGDWSLRGIDFDTLMVGEIHDTLIDAARLAKVEFNNGFPNWELFRSVYCGDEVYIRLLKRWSMEFANAVCLSGGVKRSAYSEEMANVAGWDALYALLYCQPILPYTCIAESFGVDPKTYKRLMEGIRRRMAESLEVYIMHLGSAYRQVVIYERKSTRAYRMVR